MTNSVLTEDIEELKFQKAQLLARLNCQDTQDAIAPESHDVLMAEREAIRPDGKIGLVQKLYAVYKEKYRSETFDEANRQVDAELQEKPMIKKKRSISEQLKTSRQEVSQEKKQKNYER